MSHGVRTSCSSSLLTFETREEAAIACVLLLLLLLLPLLLSRKHAHCSSPSPVWLLRMTSVEDTSMMLAFQAKSGSNCAAYAPAPSPMECSPVTISAEDLDLLICSGSLEQEMLLLSGLEPSPSAMAMHGDEFSCLLEHFDKWSSPVEPMFSTWNPRFCYQKDMADVALSETIQSGSLKSGKDQKNRYEEKEVCEKRKTALASSNTPLKAVTPSGRRIWKGGPPAMTRSSSKSRLSKPSDSSENSEDDECSLDGRTVSKNLVSERRRRKKLNERLYSLRALVPKISKMDKASIVSDAIGYVQELQKQVESIQADIEALQSCKDGSQQQLPCLVAAGVGTAKNQKKTPLAEHRILELEVAQMEEQTYHLRIHCKKGPGVLVQLTKALEALDFEIVNANLTSVNDHILNNVVVKARIGEVLTPEELKKLTLEIVPRFGLIFG
ncbi:hypothetical protein GOP47_0013868 [Adiantum capillus-veneris]|uniref:BHLH domain-containing protein n=1 Tax=Adiantum capillus-veneris TaxID=13818 RepID=A0A9D4ZEZ1_ADICA|nr:hypothetical protein GOP47_0013868 [Adiantum capillus-veneris]